MKTKFKFNLIGGDTLEAEYDTTEYSFEEFYTEVCNLKLEYIQAVKKYTDDKIAWKRENNIPLTKSQSNYVIKQNQVNNNSPILKKAVDADTRPISEGQKAILRKVGYTEESFEGLSMSDASLLVKDALSILNSK